MVSKATILAACIAVVAAAPIDVIVPMARKTPALTIKQPAPGTPHDLYDPLSETTYRPAVFRIITKKSENAPVPDASTGPSWYPPAKFGKREDGSKGNNPEAYSPLVYVQESQTGV
ncbi:hypothetical protein H634G_10394 [Metarhizium anisopliae BRIP 53293]|uniref:Uncharacterized protein n=1 Tax=Metarhizium anisopliae BRIP 53293 TaxID=1291518 RepID=A0A0D9NKH0_METAN|nr:hypothetical protein H634G_10394 [Metarhizium anisopliae BRIP 53293]KJK91851.1 hypothetical protein H633G_04274 [Metarhizium anisopliae BRIP 53284]